MTCARDLAKAERLMRTGGWHDGIEQMQVLEGKRLGVLGLGRLGSRVAGYAKAFGMDVVAWSQNLTEEKAAAGGAKLVSKDELLADLRLRHDPSRAVGPHARPDRARPISPR